MEKNKWDEMNGTIRYQGVIITRLGRKEYVVFGKKKTSFGECVLAIQSAERSLAKSIKK